MYTTGTTAWCIVHRISRIQCAAIRSSLSSIYFISFEGLSLAHFVFFFLSCFGFVCLHKFISSDSLHISFSAVFFHCNFGCVSTFRRSSKSNLTTPEQKKTSLHVHGSMKDSGFCITKLQSNVFLTGNTLGNWKRNQQPAESQERNTQKKQEPLVCCMQANTLLSFTLCFFFLQVKSSSFDLALSNHAIGN